MNTRLRILVVLPLYGGSLPIGRFCVAALTRLGHQVDVFEAPDFYEGYKGLKRLGVTGDRLDYMENSYLQLLSQAVLAKTETFEPDLVLAMAQAPMSRQALKRLRKDGVPTAMWFVEDYRLFTYWQGFAPLYDVFAVIQKEPFTEELAAVGQENVLYLPLAADPDFHKPLELTAVQRRKWGADLAFLGAGYPNRRVAFRQLLHYDFKIWGNDWEGDPVLEPYNQLGGARVSSEDAVRIFNATRVNLNLHSSVRTESLVPGGDFVNPRTFELAMCGAFQLVDHRGLLSESFDDHEMATFTSLDELGSKIDHFLGAPQERDRMAHAARQRALADHTYQRRMADLVDFAAERTGLGSRPRQAPVLDQDFPPRLARELAELMERLGLPANAGFDDVVTAVRSQSGRLSDLDTAILFLDEWRKQYGRK